MTHGIGIDSDALKQARIKNLMTQAELAYEVNCSAVHIYRLEAGKSRASLGLVQQLTKVLKLASPAVILEDKSPWA